MLQRQAIRENLLNLILSLQEYPALKEFFLVGGTGLAIQIGHRRSDDIDLFTVNDFNQEKLLVQLESDFAFRMDYMEKNTLKGYIDDIKVDFLSHRYPLIKPLLRDENIRLASIHDISAMKINAISNDGTRVKDFIDIYFLLQYFSVDQLIENYTIKYSQRNPLHALKSLIYFEDVNSSDWPVIFSESELTWEKVQKAIYDNSRNYIKKLKED